MFRWFLRNRLNAFEKRYHYNVDYARYVLEADPDALVRFSRVTAISSYCKDVPKEVCYAAGITAVLAEDCGPCVQIGVDKALAEGVSPALLKAVIERDDDALPEPVALACAFTRASLARTPEADDLRDQVLARWGKRGLISLALAQTSARLYPTLKYALGFGHACTRVNVAGTHVKPVERQPA